MTSIDPGFDQWFEAHAAGMRQEGCVFARISAVDRGSFLVLGESGEVHAELSGKLSHDIGDPAGLPCVGDWVTAQYCNEGSFAVIHGVFPRRTFLRRRSAGDAVSYQMIAANIDTAFIVQSCHFDFNPRRLDRYLVMAADGRVEPVIILTKTDLVTREDLDRKLEAAGTVAGARVIALSTVSGEGFDAFRQMLSPGSTYCLLGSSGVGKTTLVNRLIGREAFETKAVSGTGEGRHATTRRQLIVLDQGSMLIDTPGMRELGLMDTGDGVDSGFGDIAELSSSCRYQDCSHESEPGCAVRAAVENGDLSSDRYSSYIKLRKESDHYGMSYLDRRKKDRAFGRFVKSTRKQMKD